MVSIYDVEARKLIDAAAAELKKMPELAPPEWASYVKTGVHNERPPAEKDWWYVRSASILRAIYKFGPIGVSKLRTKYGGRKNRGHAPDKTFKASGNIIRKILQKLELVGLAKQDQVGVYKGRILTPKGKSFMDKLVVKTKDPYQKPVKKAKVQEKPVKKEAKTEKVVKDEQPNKVVPKEVKKNNVKVEAVPPKDMIAEEKLVTEDKPKDVKVEAVPPKDMIAEEKLVTEDKPKDFKVEAVEKKVIEVPVKTEKSDEPKVKE